MGVSGNFMMGDRGEVQCGPQNGGSVTLALAAALSMFALATGCVANEGGETLTIIHNAPPGDECEVNVELERFVARGFIDTNAAGGYFFTPVVQNSATSTNAVSRRVAMRGANIDITFPTEIFSAAEIDALNADNLLSFSNTFSGSIDAGGGFSSFRFEVLPRRLLTEMAAKVSEEPVEVTVAIEVFGDLNGGSRVISDPFYYPIDVCNGCLIRSLGTCSALGEDYPGGATGGKCQALQDGALDCCTTAANAEICPARYIGP